ncbi:MAG: proton-conducting transporter membrane subunit [Cyclobacteriaceae bacterium]|nr:proton-conducting transporter membrane subunit [Cyclobacteriaceae bacterium]MDH4298127.1 proton-conducting transporter membrane subunit [Cyclobacteriaceae bacterium]MDH5248512.1 proton-conducting transporter membrane subunit [Cyclobacteriaceae bacterium]
MIVYLFFVATALLSGTSYFIRNRNLSHGLVFAHIALLLGLAVYLLPNLGQQLDDFFFCDQLGVMFYIILIIVSLVSAIHYITFVIDRDVRPAVQALHNAGTIFFTGAIVGVLLTSHFGVLWAFMEATTLGASVLIYHNRTSESLEATWKYLFICSIGIALAFAGVLFLGLAGQQVKNVDFTFATIKSLSGQLNPLWLKACFLLVVTGFSAKMGLIPLFNVDIDAKDVSPSQVGASLSSVLMNAGFVAIYRFYEAFSTTAILHWMNNLLMITGLVSLLFAAAYMLKVRNVKRLFAYSSMEHASLVMIAFSCGGLGYFAAILHLIMHSLVKSSLFFQVSQMHRIYNSKLDENIGSYLRVNPLGGLVMLLGFLSIIAMPPSGMLISELLMFQTLIANNYWWIALIVLLLVLIVIYGLAVRMLGIVFLKKDTANINLNGSTNFESAMQLGLILLVFYIGLFRPEIIVNSINLAIKSLPA